MKREFKVETGRVVRSKAGRDEGKYFVVIALDGEEFALVADGDRRGGEGEPRAFFCDERRYRGGDDEGKIERGRAYERYKRGKYRREQKARHDAYRFFIFVFHLSASSRFFDIHSYYTK